MRRYVFLAAIFLFLVVEVTVGFVSYHLAAQSEQQLLLVRAQTVAGAFDSREISQLKGDMSDLAMPAYQSLKQRLIRIGKVSPDLVSVYVTGYRDGGVFFYADSVDNHEVGEATPGLTYEEASPAFTSVLTQGATIFEGPLADRWGTWVSGVAPILDGETGNVVASIGMDIDAKVYGTGVLTKTLVPMLLLAVVLLAVLVGYVRYVKNKELLLLKAKFVSIASHELRSPVASIVWATESLLGRSGESLPPAALNTVSLITQTGRHILDTIAEILDLAQLQSVKGTAVRLETVNMLGLILEITKSMTLLAHEHRVLLRPDPLLPDRIEIVCDRASTKRVLSNIITNAIKYSPADGTITIGYRRQGPWHGITVADQGIGIPEGEKARIFEENFRASNAQSSSIAGTGFGLHLAKDLMEAQGGNLSFETESGKGTVFFVAFKGR